MPNSASDNIKKKKSRGYNFKMHFSEFLLGKVLDGGSTRIFPSQITFIQMQLCYISWQILSFFKNVLKIVMLPNNAHMKLQSHIFLLEFEDSISIDQEHDFTACRVFFVFTARRSEPNLIQL